MKKVFGCVLAAMIFCMSGVALANCGKCGADKDSDKGATCSAGECAGKCEGGCPIAKAMAALPKMTYTVGSESACCEHSAKAMAEEAGTHMHYVVGDQEFDAKDKAMVALADVTEKFVDEYATPHTCAVSGKTTVAGNSLTCSKSAAAMASVAKEAMKTVSMTYKVGDKECSCPNEAASLAKSTGKEEHFVIGDKETCCSVDARIKLAQAKYMAAVKAIAAAAAPAEEPANKVTSSS